MQICAIFGHQGLQTPQLYEYFIRIGVLITSSPSSIQIRLLRQLPQQIRYGTFILGHPVPFPISFLSKGRNQKTMFNSLSTLSKISHFTLDQILGWSEKHKSWKMQKWNHDWMIRLVRNWANVIYRKRRQFWNPVTPRFQVIVFKFGIEPTFF